MEQIDLDSIRLRTNEFFSTPIWSSVVEFDYAPVVERTLQFQPMERFNLYSYPEYKEMLSVLELRLLKISKNIHPDFKVVIGDAWVNNNTEWGYNPGTTFTGNIFVRIGTGGAVRFRRPSMAQHYPINDMGSKLFQTYVDYRGDMNKVTIFPSWLEHCLTPSDDLAITFDIHQV